MTTTQALREYLDAHGIDGPPACEGWFVVELHQGTDGVLPVLMVLAVAGPSRLTLYVGGTEHSVLLRTDIVRHAPLNLAPLAGRDLDAEVIDGVRAERSR